MNQPKIDCKAEFIRLSRLANTETSCEAFQATMSAEFNALETFKRDETHPDFYRVAYDSIQCTSAFEDATIRAWLEANGYQY